MILGTFVNEDKTGFKTVDLSLSIICLAKLRINKKIVTKGSEGCINVFVLDVFSLAL